jgi:predicted acetyltransferase
MVEFGIFQAGDEPECLDLWTNVFGVSRIYFERYFWGDKHWKPDYTRLCRVDGNIVSAVQIVRRMIHLNHHAVPMAGIANVATHPQHRGQGYSTQLLKDAHEVMDAEDFLFGLLFTGIHEFYGRLGWHSMPGGVWMAEPAPVNLSGWHFREAMEADLHAVMAWYAKFNVHHSCSVMRDEDYWHGWRRWNDPEWRRGTYIAEQDGRPVGYVAIAQHNQRDEAGNVSGVASVQAREIGCDPLDRLTLQAILGFLSDTAYRVNANSVVINLPEHGYEGVLRHVLKNLHYHTKDGGMVRVGDRSRLIEAFRLIYPAIRPEQVPDHPETALRLFFGSYKTRPEGVDRATFKHFPPRPIIYWEHDGF